MFVKLRYAKFQLSGARGTFSYFGVGNLMENWPYRKNIER